MISEDGRGLLADYGVASLIDAVFDNSAGCSLYDTACIRWMAPETMEPDRESSTKVDIWAFGMTALICHSAISLYLTHLLLLQELFTRRPPFHNIPAIRDVIDHIMTGPPDRPSDQATYSHLTNAWWNICNSCWNCVSSQRPSMPKVLRMMEHKIGYISPRGTD
ncbi:kinase-like domain-containing protein [Scleroderma citrinum]